MLIKINGVALAEYPVTFQVTPMDIDDGESSVRTADATLNRDRIAVKRQIDMEFGVLAQDKIASILQSMSNSFFEVYYPDPIDGYTTRTMYAGNRPAQYAYESKGVIYWKDLKVVLTER